MTTAVDPDLDLPILANVDEIRARHYIIDLKVNFEHKNFSGEVIVILEPLTEEIKEGTRRE